VTDTTDKETNERTNERTDGLTDNLSVRPSLIWSLTHRESWDTYPTLYVRSYNRPWVTIQLS